MYVADFVIIILLAFGAVEGFKAAGRLAGTGQDYAEELDRPQRGLGIQF